MEQGDMRWEESVLALFEDLEQQAEGLHLIERDAEVEELSIAEYAQVSLVSRLHASVNHVLGCRLVGGRVLSGRLAQAGADWVLIEDDHAHEWVLPLGALATVSGLSARSVSEEARSLQLRLSLRSMLRRIAQTRSECVLHLRDGTQIAGRFGRVGEDFVELYPTGSMRAAEIVPNAALVAVQGPG